ncbi:hypothetical protein PPYR_13265 [Photinus pyralis]|uniref:DUF1868 domain-containing protein n=1 Tax=Photinus pyralis TaxID=7054 RepID=A0A1Y1M9B0_PHOPY|nr:hypothetical protein PPYR_13265 [Photinus pyralis]
MSTHKVSETGIYKPFYGYTAVSMVDDAENRLKDIEDFLTTSVISNYYAPLPHYTYHMTTFNVYPLVREPLPAVKRWLDQRGETKVDHKQFLPENVLKSQHRLAIKAIEDHIGFRNLTIRNVILTVGTVIKLNVELEPEDDLSVQSLRKRLAEIYEYPDEGLKYHITLAYLYKHLPETGSELSTFEEDISKLRGMTEVFKNYKLNKHDVYLFDSMINFIPYKDA